MIGELFSQGFCEVQLARLLSFVMECDLNVFMEVLMYCSSTERVKFTRFLVE